MSLITMPREMGSLGKDVAALVAQKLGKTVVHDEIVDQLANKMRLRKSHVVRFLEGKAGMWEKMTTDETSLSIHTADEIFRVAEDNSVAVIRGWGATHLLAEVPHVVRVRVCAPFELKVKRMMERLQTDDRAFVEKEIRLSDEAHGAITRRHFDIQWKDAEHYDLILNTERLGIAECADEIIKLLEESSFRETAESLGKLKNLALAAHVRAALRHDPRTAKLNITIDSDNGRVTLSGIADVDTTRHVAEITASVPGVISVNNALKNTTRAHRRFDS
jgi:cytidylate kinase